MPELKNTIMGVNAGRALYVAYRSQPADHVFAARYEVPYRGEVVALTARSCRIGRTLSGGVMVTATIPYLGFGERHTFESRLNPGWTMDAFVTRAGSVLLKALRAYDLHKRIEALKNHIESLDLSEARILELDAKANHKAYRDFTDEEIEAVWTSLDPGEGR